MKQATTFTVVMPSYLEHYKNAAKDRVRKFHRAVRSVINQSFANWELYVIADGCVKTFDIVLHEYIHEPRIKCSLINKQPLMSGNVRNLGIAHGTGNYVVYLDTDDFFGTEHLKNISDSMKPPFQKGDWFWFDDYVLNGSINKQRMIHATDTDLFKRRLCNIKTRSRCGTSNICHERNPELLWKDDSYLHDWKFITDLKKMYPNYFRVESMGQYYVCHIPTIYDV